MNCRYCEQRLTKREHFDGYCSPCSDIRARVRKDDESIRAMLAELDFDRQAELECVPSAEEIWMLDRITKGM